MNGLIHRAAAAAPRAPSPSRCRLHATGPVLLDCRVGTGGVMPPGLGSWVHQHPAALLAILIFRRVLNGLGHLGG